MVRRVYVNTYEWKDADHDVYYYYGTTTGRIVGQVHKISHTKIWATKVNEENYLGQYISLEFAKLAVEQYWDIQERTYLGNV
jgi:hypothetical protein